MANNEENNVAAKNGLKYENKAHRESESGMALAHRWRRKARGISNGNGVNQQKSEMIMKENGDNISIWRK